MRDEMLAGFIELVFRDSRIVMFGGERREVSIEGRCVRDGD